MSDETRSWLVLSVFVTGAWVWYLVVDNTVHCVPQQIKYESISTNDPNTAKGQLSTHQNGVMGSKQVCTKKATKDKIVYERVLVSPVPEIVYVGTKEPTVIAPVYTSTRCVVTTCRDGSCSYSTGRGTCSWHGGIAY